MAGNAVETRGEERKTMRTMRMLLVLGVACGLLATGVARAEEVDAKAVAAAKAWLALADAGSYGETWDTAAAQFKVSVARDDWAKDLGKVRSRVGALTKRELFASRTTTTLPKAPEGKYTVLQFRTAFANAAAAEETVTLMLEKDGTWRVAGYNLSDAPDAKAVAAAKAWLALVDAGSYNESYDTAAALFKGALTQDAWAKALTASRTPLGAVQSRTLAATQSTTSLPGAPDGKYVVMQYRTVFAQKASALETLTVMLDKDGVWRVAGYFIK